MLSILPSTRCGHGASLSRPPAGRRTAWAVRPAARRAARAFLIVLHIVAVLCSKSLRRGIPRRGATRTALRGIDPDASDAKRIRRRTWNGRTTLGRTVDAGRVWDIRVRVTCAPNSESNADLLFRRRIAALLAVYAAVGTRDCGRYREEPAAEPHGRRRPTVLEYPPRVRRAGATGHVRPAARWSTTRRKRSPTHRPRQSTPLRCDRAVHDSVHSRGNRHGSTMSRVGRGESRRPTRRRGSEDPRGIWHRSCSVFSFDSAVV